MSNAKAFEDRRFRRDVQEHFTRLLDSCILVAGRAPEASLFGRRAAREVDESKSAELEDSVVDLSDAALASEVTIFLADRAFPALRQLAMDADRVVAVCTNAVYYIVQPALKTKSRNFEVNVSALGLLAQICTIPNSIKAWRSAVQDAFNDARFFRSPAFNAKVWRKVIYSAFSLDKERLGEAIARIGVAPSANIFANREAEARLRAMNIRRLAFILFSGDIDIFLPHFPAIQERIVDLLKGAIPEIVEAEVWLCLRVILCRFSSQQLTSLWPVIIAEMMRVFEGMLNELPPDGSDRLNVVLQVAKFLDLLLTLQTPEFQSQQWLFVNDTTDVVYPPDDWTSEAIVDAIVGKLGTRASNKDAPAPRAHKLRRPILDPGSIDMIDDLAPFFRTVSLTSYESIYNSVGIDTDVIESLLLHDMFEESQ